MFHIWQRLTMKCISGENFYFSARGKRHRCLWIAIAEVYACRNTEYMNGKKHFCLIITVHIVNDWKDQWIDIENSFLLARYCEGYTHKHIECAMCKWEMHLIQEKCFSIIYIVPQSIVYEENLAFTIARAGCGDG